MSQKERFNATLIFIANEDDFDNKIKSQMGEYWIQKIIRFWNYPELETYINDAPEDEEIILFIHYNAVDPNKGYKRGIQNDISHNYPKLKIHYNTSGNGKDIAAKEPNMDGYQIFDNSKIRKAVEEDKVIHPQSIANIRGENETITTGEKQGKPYIFFSHSSEDKKIANAFRQKILQLALDLSENDIFFSSNPATGVNTGEDIPNKIKEALDKTSFFFRYVSKNYNNSIVCHNEYGAAWYKFYDSPNKIITLKAPDLNKDEIDFLSHTCPNF
jgi:hypothetical protein